MSQTLFRYDLMLAFGLFMGCVNNNKKLRRGALSFTASPDMNKVT